MKDAIKMMENNMSPESVRCAHIKAEKDFKMAEKKAFKSIMKGLTESLEYAKGGAKARKMSVIVAELPQYHDKEQIYFYLADKGVKK